MRSTEPHTADFFNAMKRFVTLAATTLISALTLSASLPFTPDRDNILLTHDGTEGEFVFNDALKAMDYINRSGRSSITLHVAPSVYWLDDPDDPEIRRNRNNSQSIPFAAEIRCDTLRIKGLTDDPQNVVFAVNRGQTQGALGNYTMLHFKGHSLEVSNMTFGNYCNVDLIYPANPALDRKRRRDAIVQAQVGICDGTDRLLAENCRFISRLNLCPLVGARRSLYYKCYFECTDDALSGSAVYLDCDFTFHSGKPFYATSPTGAVFLDCDIHTLVSGTQYLTKVPAPVTMIDTRFTADNSVTLRWFRDDSPVHCYQSGVTLNGTPVFIDADRPGLSTDISDKQLLRAYKTENGYNIANLLAGDDGWNPLGLSVDKSDLHLPVSLRLNASNNSMKALDDTIIVSPFLRLWGDYPLDETPKDMSWTAPTTLGLVKDGTSVKAISNNRFPVASDAMVSLATSYGLKANSIVNIEPYLTEAPEFRELPRLKASKGNILLSYSLTDGDGADESSIVWYRSTRPDLSDSVAVRQGIAGSGATYTLGRADEGCYISATVTPKRVTTVAGNKETAALDRQVSKLMLIAVPGQEKKLFTTFAEIPIRSNGIGRKGIWTFDTFKPEETSRHDWVPDSTRSWYYGRGVDAATGIGLVQATKGARLSYIPARDKSKKMTVRMVAEPSKGPGQGFGSATGQYMDIGVKFDPVTRTGYALRIERTPEFDKAVTFTLMRMENGIATPLTAPVASDCYRTPCHISVSFDRGTIEATAHTEAQRQPNANPAVLPSVRLSAQVPMLDGSALYIQHTGSVGSSATLLRDMEMEWE